MDIHLGRRHQTRCEYGGGYEDKKPFFLSFLQSVIVRFYVIRNETTNPCKLPQRKHFLNTEACEQLRCPTSLHVFF